MPAAVDGIKQCSKCLRELPVSSFDKAWSNPDGYQYSCRKCSKVVRALRREKELEYRRKYYKKNRNWIRQASSKYDCGEKAKLRNRKWRSANPEKQAACCRSWNKRNPERTRHHACQRRARRAAAEGRYTLEQWKTRCLEYANRCAYCGKKRKLTRHHVTPLCKGGSNFIENIVPACLSCNCKIHDKVVLPKKGLL